MTRTTARLRSRAALGEGSGRCRARSQRRGEGGATLVEALVSIAILSILLLGVMAGITTSLRASSNNHDVALVRGIFTTITDRAASIKFPDCGESLDQLGQRVATSAQVPSDYTVTVTGVENLLPAGGACSSSTTVRLLKLTVTKTDGTASLSGDVVVRDIHARPA